MQGSHAWARENRNILFATPTSRYQLSKILISREALVTALKQLGICDAYHGYSAIFDNPRDCEMWVEALDAKFEGKGQPYCRAQFDQLMGHCQAISDMPATCFARELIEAYPEAKVVLTLRKDVDAWYK